MDLDLWRNEKVSLFSFWLLCTGVVMFKFFVYKGKNGKMPVWSPVECSIDPLIIRVDLINNMRGTMWRTATAATSFDYEFIWDQDQRWVSFWDQLKYL